MKRIYYLGIKEKLYNVMRTRLIFVFCAQAEAEVRRLKDAITQAQEEEREQADMAIQAIVSNFVNKKETW